MRHACIFTFITMDHSASLVLVSMGHLPPASLTIVCTREESRADHGDLNAGPGKGRRAACEGSAC
jgi:hypothetical protein